MIQLEEYGLSEVVLSELDGYVDRVRSFRAEGSLDPVAVAKLQEHFKASHVYNSAGIEGNRLTLQETLVVLREGVDVSDRPLKDTVEVANLGKAFDFMRTLCNSAQTLRETDIRDLHALIVADDARSKPGQYRTTGVVISGADHRPPEPLAVPALMAQLLQWINDNADQNPTLVASIAHHKLAAIHPFLDGNGRVSRLLMNLILMRAGLPIANIKREDRPKYYEALSYADVGLLELLVQMVFGRSSDLFAEYVRIREETKRMAEWAARWGDKEAQVLLRRESRELELWQSRVRQVFLEFQKAAEVLNDELDLLTVEFFDYQSEITLEKYDELKRGGSTERANAFAITFRDRKNRRERFTFKYFRDWSRFAKSQVIPLDLLRLDDRAVPPKYTLIGESEYSARIRLRSLYFTDAGEFVMRYWNPGAKKEVEERGKPIQEAVQLLFDDVLRNVFGMA
jgi:Fic family protein